MNNPISCIITDDEPYARKGLQGYIEKIDFLELRGSCEDAIELSDLLSHQPVDLLFLDIQMPFISGIEFLETVQNPPKVIFTTAFEQYAIQGFELEVIDYLLKPISYDRFIKAAWKARNYFELKQCKDQLPYLFVKTNGRLEKIVFDDILFIEGMENYVAIYCRDKKIITLSTIKALLEKLPVKRFIQTHKSYIASINNIDSIEGNIISIQKYRVPISKYLRKSVLESISR
ncbi:LytR/AlgR family response regulator transcription factor [Pedobacter antarcticus]|uniref:LytR/AlgR family response regulator transcription factor n=1 Tax=Pedobacter antarcticus TaxID=34086 RepID=UPI0008882586|nr:LytTR family DNA-binding domain-containing protein [Pedobacter antarcticus]SDM86205.1 two component transcriptional regulator, LytTR family [Pedobacter antarcticus]